MQLCSSPECHCRPSDKGEPDLSLAKLPVSNEGQQPSCQTILLSHWYCFTTPDPWPWHRWISIKLYPADQHPGDLVIVPSDVKSVQCFCRIVVLKTSCNREQQKMMPIRKTYLLPKQEFLAIILVLAKACIFLAQDLLYGPIFKSWCGYE